MDEAERFYTDPQKWLQEEFSNTTLLPTHVVFFNVLEQVREQPETSPSP